MDTSKILAELRLEREQWRGNLSLERLALEEPSEEGGLQPGWQGERI